MRTDSRAAVAVTTLVLVLALVTAGCGGTGGGAAGAGGPAVPAAFKADAAKAVDLAITDKGGGTAVAVGDAKAAVSVPPGSAKAGATWKVVPLTEAPAAVKKPLSAGVYVDVAGAAPTGLCAVGFSLPGTASPDAAIVRISDDGKSTEVVATTRIVTGGRTLLSAYVDGFSAYTTSEEDAAARDKAFVEGEKKRGKTVDWTIKAGGTETREVEGWKFTYELDLFASGGGTEQGGTYKGHSMLSVDGKYTAKDMPAFIKTFGKVNGIGRDQALTFTMIDPSLGYLLGPGAPDDPQVDAYGTMKLEGMGSLDIRATAPNVKGQYTKNNVQGSGGVPFTIAVKGEDVQVEIPDVGIFPGKILRTSK